ncbi:MAG: hypothetical protein AB1425_01835 [Actinomycetota bacterium]|nr:hypothetical protein [Rubrobacter sp.]
MEERRHFSSRSLLLGALVSFVLAALASAVIGRYWFTLSQVGFAVAIALILAGVERKGGAVWPVLFWGSLAVGVLAILAEGLV